MWECSGLSRLEVADDVVGRLSLRLATRDDAATFVVEHLFGPLEVGILGLPDAVGLAAGQVEAVEERMVARGRGSGACQIDGATVRSLHHHRLASRRAREHRSSGITVCVLEVAVPDHPWLAGTRGDLDQQHLGPLLGAIQREHEGGTPVLGPGERVETELCACDFQRVGVEGWLAHHQSVAILGFRPRVAAVQRFNPHEGVRVAGVPAEAARPLGNAVDGNILREGE
jgi:hypothetical protein